MDGIESAGQRRPDRHATDRATRRYERNTLLPDRRHDHRRTDRPARRIPRHHRPHQNPQQTQTALVAIDHHLLYVRRAGQHDHDDHYDHAAAAYDQRTERTMDLRQRYRHRGQQRRCLFAHRRRNDHHALDAGQRHLGPARGQTVPPGPGIGNHSHGHRLPLYSRRKRASRKIRHGAQAAAVRRPALQPLRSRSRCRRAAVRAHIQGCNGTAALPGHADIVGCAVGLHGARL